MLIAAAYLTESLMITHPLVPLGGKKQKKQTKLNNHESGMQTTSVLKCTL